MYFSVLGSVIPSIGDPPCSGAHCSARFAFQIPFASLRACLRFLREEKRAATSKAEVALLSLATTGTTRAHAQIDDKFFTPVRLIPGITPLKLSFKTGVSRGQVERRQRAIMATAVKPHLRGRIERLRKTEAGNPRILAIGAANPPHRFTQEEAYRLAGYDSPRILDIFL